jgi:glycosyltransferase involved in cell wall biosynthesis
VSDPLVSIITTTFNHRRFIEMCISSVMHQSYTQWEQIVIDDASSDGTAAVAEAIANASPKVRVVVHEKNYGADRLAESYNEALRLARGEFVAVLEGDDWWTPKRLAAQVPLLVSDAVAVLCYADCREVDETGRRVGRIATPVLRDSLRTSPADAVSFFGSLTSFPSNTVLIRRSALEAVGGFRAAPGVPLVDYPTWLELSLTGSFVRVPSALGYWRRHRGSTSWQSLERTAVGMHEFYTRFVERHRNAIGADTDIEDLLRKADHTLARKRKSLPYLDGQYELLYGSSRLARRKLLAVATASKTPMSYRASAILGLVGSVTSRRLFAGLLAAKRRVLRRRCQVR